MPQNTRTTIATVFASEVAKTKAPTDTEHDNTKGATTTDVDYSARPARNNKQHGPAQPTTGDMETEDTTEGTPPKNPATPE